MKSYDSYKRNQSITKTLVLVFTATILLFSVIIGMYFLFFKDRSAIHPDDPLSENKTSQFGTLVGKFTDREIKNEESAVLAMQDIAEELGLTNAVEELTPKSTNTVDNLTYYRLQQNYQGIPVYGCSFVVITDENGEAKGLTGNATDIDADISLIPTVTQEQVEASIRAYAGEGAEISVPKLSDDMLVIYNYDDVEKATLAYKFAINIESSPHLFLINAWNSTVLHYSSLTYYDDTGAVLPILYRMNQNIVQEHQELRTEAIVQPEYDEGACFMDWDGYIDDMTVTSNVEFLFDWHIHSFGNQTQTKAPFCAEAGEERRNGDTCDYGEAREIKNHDHTYNCVVTPPTCTEQGYTTYSCDCGDSYEDDYTAATGHSYAETIIPPTCEEHGYKLYTCQCGDSYSVFYKNALRHNYGEWVQTEAPTCTEFGEERRWCDRCGGFEVRVMALPTQMVSQFDDTFELYLLNLPNNMVSQEFKASFDQITEIVLSLNIKATSGTITLMIGNSPGDSSVACLDYDIEDLVQDDGWVTFDCAYPISIVPNQVYYLTVGARADQRVTIRGKLFEPGAYTYDRKAFGGWLKDSHTLAYQIRSNLFATGHDYTSVTTAPTCTEQGYTTHTCYCGECYVDSYVDALNHSFGDWHIVEEPTCAELGEEYRDCNRCDHFETREIATTEHTYEAIATVPTCTEQGYTTYTCHCGDSYVDSYVDALGHRFGVWEEIKASTCTEPGEELRDCDRCGHLETCEIAAMGHTYEAIVTAPTCTEQGYTIHTCHCGDSYVDSYVDALGHNYGERTQTKAPTCTEGGEERKVCQACDHFEAFELSKIEHVDNDLNGSCDRCGERTRLDEKSSDGCFGVMRFSSCSMLLLLGLCFVVLKRKKD